MSIEGKDIARLAKAHPFAMACGVASLVLLLAFYFRLGTVGEIQSAIDARSQVAAKLKSNVAHSALLDGQLESLSAANKLLKEAALNPLDLAENQRLFYGLERATGVRVNLTQLGSPAPAKGTNPLFIPVNFSVGLSGDYAAMFNYIMLLEKGGGDSRAGSPDGLSPPSRVSTAVLSVAQDGGTAATVSLVMLGLRQ